MPILQRGDISELGSGQQAAEGSQGTNSESTSLQMLKLPEYLSLLPRRDWSCKTKRTFEEALCDHMVIGIEPSQCGLDPVCIWDKPKSYERLARPSASRASHSSKTDVEKSSGWLRSNQPLFYGVPYESV